MYRKLGPLKGQCLQPGRPHLIPEEGLPRLLVLLGEGCFLIGSPEGATRDQITHGCLRVLSLSGKRGGAHEGQGWEM